MIKKVKSYLNENRLLPTFLLSLLLIGTSLNLHGQILDQLDIEPWTCHDQSLIDLNMQVPTVYEPVCGCDGITYPNAETAMYHHGIVETTPGPCSPCNIELDLSSLITTCNGATACVTVIGGTPPYTVTLNGQSNTNTAGTQNYCYENLQAGSYQLFVADGKGCTATLQIEVPVVDYNLMASVQPVSCFEGHDGAIDLMFLENVPLQFNWYGPNGFYAQTEDIEQLTAGWYEVMVSSANGECYATATYEVTQPSALKLELVFTEPACSAQVDGCAIISGGTAPYALWVFEGNLSAGSIPDVQVGDIPTVANMQLYNGSDFEPNNPNDSIYCANNIPNGTYLVLAIDANGCYEYELVTIESGEGMELFAEATNVSCHGASDGMICFNVIGVQPPYEAHLTSEDGTIQTTIDIQCFENLPAGIYTLTVFGANGCHASKTLKIETPNPLTMEFIRTSEACSDQVDGCLLINGGTQPYHLWVFTCDNPTTGLPTPNIDVNGNVTIDGMTPTDAANFDASVIVGNEVCAQDIPAGTYYVLVVDENRCWAFEVIEIETPDPLTMEFIRTSEACSGQVDGCLLINGGTQPYHLWVFTCDDPTTGLPTPNIDANGNVTIDGMTPTDAANFDASVIVGNEVCAQDIPAGMYYVLVVDENRCWAFEVIEIETPDPLTMEFIRTSEACSGQVDGCLLINGGTQPYHLWVFTCDNPTTDLPTPNIDANGNVTIDGMIQTDAANFDASVIVGNEVCAQDIPAGTYYVLVVDENHCWAFEVIEIEAAEGITVSGEVTNVACNQSGAIDLTVSGANPPYFFQWSNGATTEDIEGLSAGTYTVQVYSSNDYCTTEASFTVEGSDDFELEFSFDTYGDFACVEPIGGTAPFTIEWMNLGNGNTLPSTDLVCVYNIEQGVYMVTVKDANGCIVSEIFAIEERPCHGGVAIVDPAEIFSGDQTVFQLSDYSGLSIQWQFKMDFTDWLNIPGATSDYFITPPINMGLDNEVEVRAAVICDDGTVLYSTVDILYIIGSNDFNAPSAEAAVAKGLFNWETTTDKTKQLTSKAFPTVTNSDVTLSFKGEGQTKATITITDFKGKVHDLYELDYVVEGMTKDLVLNNYAHGMYFVTVTYKDFVETHRVFIER